MTEDLTEDALADELLAEELLHAEQCERASEHPAFLLQHVKCIDSRSGEVFDFQLLTAAERDAIRLPSAYNDFERASRETSLDLKNWNWQRELLDWWLTNDSTVVLKGRQLGVTWVACGLALWYLLYKPGADVLVYSITEDDAKEVIGRIWDMLQSLLPEKEHLLNGSRIIKPSRAGVRPSESIEVEHTLASGQRAVSSITAMSSASSAGHGRSAALVVFDEASRQQNARTVWKAVVPATADKGGKVCVISTANGMSDERTGDGNYYHYLWSKAGTFVFPSLKTMFLGWWLHPDRDQAWYDSLDLDDKDKAEQFPNDPDEAFLLSGNPYFDHQSLRYYARHKAKALFQAAWEPKLEQPNVAKLVERSGGFLEVYKMPEEGSKYALAADVASGTGLDFSVGAIIDLHTGEPCAELYMHAGYDDFAEQLHFTGLWYNSARLAVESQGGYGSAVIAYLRDGLKGRKPYPGIYRHRKLDRPDHIESRTYGFPMDQKTRPKVVNELRSWVNGHLFPCVTPGFLGEARTFVYRDHGTSPAAADGCNDDRVMAWGISLELYALYGEHEHDRRKKTRQKTKQHKPKRLHPW